MDSNLQIIRSLESFIDQATTQKAKYCTRLEDFSRTRLLGFKQVCYFILNLSKRSLCLELNDFFEALYPESKIPSKSAFSQARYKALPVIFQDWNTYLLQQIEAHGLFADNWLGFRLIGVDGTTAKLPDTASIYDEFGTSANQHEQSKYALAHVVCIYDVLNKFCLSSAIRPISSSESGILKDLMGNLPDNSLGIYDRGFASFWLAYLLDRERKDFVIRCRTNFNSSVKSFVKSSKMSRVVDWPANTSAIKLLEESGIPIDKNAHVKVRLVKVILDTGEVEVLISSLVEKEKYPTTAFKELYFQRWGVEVFFDLLKNIIQVECFTGHKPQAVYQEFYAMILLANIHTLLRQGCEQELKKANKTRKYEHQINNNIMAGLIKYRIIELIQNATVAEWLALMQKILRHTEPIRPNRKNPRPKAKRMRGKFKTYTNYRRAV